MKGLAWIIAGLSASCMLGCDTRVAESREANTRIVQSINSAAIRNAVIRQHTLYPYHFEPESVELNELGERELDVLVDYYRRSPGALNIRRADTPKPLYEGRVSTIRDMLAKAGVDVAGMSFQDGIAGGDGRAAAEVIAISEDRNSPSNPLYYGKSNGGESRTGTNSSLLDEK